MTDPAAPLGQWVTVTIDRPLGSVHPDWPNLYYPVNYGYVAGVMAPDGEEQDAYVLGVDTPCTQCTGRVIALVCPHRPEIDRHSIECGLGAAQHHRHCPADGGIRPVGLDQLRSHPQGAAAAEGPHQHQGQGFSGNPQHPQGRSQGPGQQIKGPGGP